MYVLCICYGDIDEIGWVVSMVDKKEETKISIISHLANPLIWFLYTLGIVLRYLIPQTYFSLGFVYHLNGNVNKAISYYHKSLKYKHDNQFGQEMLSRALADAS